MSPWTQQSLGAFAKGEEGRAELYGDTRKVLLEWNKRVSGNSEEDEDARELLRVAFERRAHLLKGPARGSSKSQFLEGPSSELLRALTVLRPEAADFKNQEFLDILVMMWANVRIGVSDLDNKLKLLTMKALIDEIQSNSYASNAEKLSGVARLMSVARLQLDADNVERLEIKMDAFKQKLREIVTRRVIDNIKLGHRELTGVKLAELQELTKLQAAQK